MIEEQDIEEQSVDLQPLRVWAEKAGHLPETSKGTRLRPVKFNRLSWIPRVVCVQQKLTLDSIIPESTYLAAVAAVESR